MKEKNKIKSKELAFKEKEFINKNIIWIGVVGGVLIVLFKEVMGLNGLPVLAISVAISYGIFRLIAKIIYRKVK